MRWPSSLIPPSCHVLTVRASQQCSVTLCQSPSLKTEIRMPSSVRKTRFVVLASLEHWATKIADRFMKEIFILTTKTAFHKHNLAFHLSKLNQISHPNTKKLHRLSVSSWATWAWVVNAGHCSSSHFPSSGLSSGYRLSHPRQLYDTDAHITNRQNR